MVCDPFGTYGSEGLLVAIVEIAMTPARVEALLFVVLAAEDCCLEENSRGLLFYTSAFLRGQNKKNRRTLFRANATACGIARGASLDATLQSASR